MSQKVSWLIRDISSGCASGGSSSAFSCCRMSGHQNHQNFGCYSYSSIIYKINIDSANVIHHMYCTLSQSNTLLCNNRSREQPWTQFGNSYRAWTAQGFSIIIYRRMEIEILQDYEILKELGQGAFASVYLARSKTSQELFAIKKVNLKECRDKDRQCALTEVRLLASVFHQNIIGFVDAFFNQKQEILYVVMEYAARGDLSKKIEYLKSKRRYIPEEEIWKFIRQMANALKVLHDNQIIHRDLKSANIFITEEGNYKLADFNVAKIIKNYNGLAQTKVGTPLYTSPEVWNSEGYGVRSDIWSLGVIVYEFASLQLPFPANTFPELYQKISRGKVTRIPSNYSDDLERVISNMLHKNPTKRPSADQLIEYSMYGDIKVPFNVGLKPRCSMLETIKNPTELQALKLSSQRLKTENQHSICQKERVNHVSNSFHYKNSQNQNQNYCDSPVITVRDRIKSHFRSKVVNQKTPNSILSLKSSKVQSISQLGSGQGTNSHSQIKKQHIALKPLILNFEGNHKPPLPTSIPYTQRIQGNPKQSKKILRLPSLSSHKS